MKYPQMIIFDYGHTLLYEPGWDAVTLYAPRCLENGKYMTSIPSSLAMRFGSRVPH